MILNKNSLRFHKRIVLAIILTLTSVQVISQDKQFSFSRAQFIGGDSAFAAFINNNLEYPAEEKKNRIQASPVLEFDLDTNGIVTNVRKGITVPSSAAFDAEAKRVLNLSPKWTPSIINGQKVPSYVHISIPFKPDSSGELQRITFDQLHMVVETAPEFPGGEVSFNKYLQNSIVYPDSAKWLNQQGTVYAKARIDSSGNVIDVYVVKGVPNAPCLDQEAIRVLRASPQWFPATANGRMIQGEISIPIRFILFTYEYRPWWKLLRKPSKK